MEEIDLALGDQFVNNALAFAQRKYSTQEGQVKELRRSYEVARALSHAKYSMPLLAAEIDRLEEQAC